MIEPTYREFPVSTVYAIEISGVCNYEAICKHCPMHNRPRNRPRGLMSDENVNHSLRWVEKLGKYDFLNLHNFGEPLIHPKFSEIAFQFSQVQKITMSTNGELVDEKMADKLAAVRWAWISVSDWKPEVAIRAARRLIERGIRVRFPPGVVHDFAGQAEGPRVQKFAQCDFLSGGRAVIRWDGTIASCCITDREVDKVGHVSSEPSEVKLRDYSLCASCHLMQ